MEIRVVNAVPAAVEQALRARVAHHTALRKALADGMDLVESLPMDEFTRDVVMRVDEGAWLVYDTT